MERLSTYLYAMSVVAFITCNGIAKSSLMFDAVSEGNKEIIGWMLEHGEDVDQRDEQGVTPLMTAARNNSLDMVQFLLDNSASLEAADRDNKTALFVSGENGFETILNYLLSKGADYAAADKWGRTVLHASADREQCDVLDTLANYPGLVNATDDWGRTAVWYAAFRGNEDCFQRLANKGALLDSDVLIAAVNGGNVEIVKPVLNVYNDVNTVNASEMTLLQIACDKRNEGVATFLVENGADVSKNGNALHLCSFSNSLLKLLMSKDLNLNGEDADGLTPLQRAAQNNDPTAVSNLIDQGANVNFKNDNDKTAAEIAMESDSVDALAKLVEKGYDINSVISNKTLCHLAAVTGSTLSMKYLTGSGANCNTTDALGRTPVHGAMNNIETLRVLLESGLDADSVDSNGKTALQLAVDEVNTRAAKCLVKYGADAARIDRTSKPGDRYTAYVKNPLISTRQNIYSFFDSVLNGETKLDDIDC